jgi:hypothetical protein
MHERHTANDDSLTVPSAIRDSPLMKKGGCAIYKNFPSGLVCAGLLAESRLCLSGAVATAVATSEDAQERGGNPARRFISASGSDEQARFYHDPKTARFLARLCIGLVCPTGECGTYTYYARPGDHLALHRDIETCDIAVITCLLDRHRRGSAGGLTRFYPARQYEMLSSIRATPDVGAVSVRLQVGHTMVMFGGVVPHLIDPLGPGELRVVSILCFRVCAD